MTNRGVPLFRVSEFESGQPWIVMEQFAGDKLDCFKRTIGFDLMPGTPLSEAKEIAAYLQKTLIMISES